MDHFPGRQYGEDQKDYQGREVYDSHPDGTHEPHTGAAALAMRVDLFRKYILELTESSPSQVWPVLETLGIDNLDDINFQPATIVPVNLTYYPMRATDNIASSLASKLVKDISERTLEEIMTEGTMLLSGVDLDIRIGKPIVIEEFLDPEWLTKDMVRDGITGYGLTDRAEWQDARRRTTDYAAIYA